MSEETNTLEQPSEYDALPKLRPGEPYFALVGRDRLAPALVLEWARLHREKVLREYREGNLSDERYEDELRQATNAEGIAWSMQSWKAGQEIAKAEDLPLMRPTYTGYEIPEEQAKRDAEQRGRSRAIAALHNAVAELTDAAPLLEANGNSSGASIMSNIADLLKTVAQDLQPFRPIIDAHAGAGAPEKGEQ